MILKISHVIISTVNFEKTIDTFCKFGYRPELIKNKIKNVAIKEKLMRKYSKTQSLAILRKKGSYSVELVDHDHFFDERSCYMPVFEGVSPQVINTNTKISLAGEDLVSGIMTPIGIPAFFSLRSSPEIRFNKLCVTSPNTKKTASFFQNLGFKVLAKDKNFIKLKFTSPIDLSSYELYVISGKKIGCFLDNVGANCVSFICTSAENERKILDRKFEVTEIEQIKLEKTLNIFFARGPFEELVEIIEPTGGK
ncbi:MAG: hypothetical protein QXS37_06255 [Candidatus Aenigmatarchaeota archaeon]